MEIFYEGMRELVDCIVFEVKSQKGECLGGSSRKSFQLGKIVFWVLRGREG